MDSWGDEIKPMRPVHVEDVQAEWGPAWQRLLEWLVPLVVFLVAGDRTKEAWGFWLGGLAAVGFAVLAAIGVQVALRGVGALRARLGLRALRARRGL